MLNWYKSLKKTKSYNDDIKKLNQINDKKSELFNKLKEINESNLSYKEKKEITDIIKIQIDIINKDILIFGAGMQHYFNNNVITKPIPIGVDMIGRRMKSVDNKKENLNDLVVNILSTDIPKETSFKTQKIYNDIIDLKKVLKSHTNRKSNITKSKLKPKFKVALYNKHNEKIDKYNKKFVQDVNKHDFDVNNRYLREYKIIKEIVLETHKRNNLDEERILDLSYKIFDVERKLINNGLYKKMVYISDLESFINYPYISVDSINKITDEWISDLEKTDKYVFLDVK